MSEEDYSPPEFQRDVLKIPPQPNGVIKITKPGNKKQWEERCVDVAKQEFDPDIPNNEIKHWWQVLAHKVLTARTTKNHPKFKNPEELLYACIDYLKWTEENPIAVPKEAVDKDGNVVRYNIYKPRVPTIGGLQVFIQINSSVWQTYYRVRPEFEDVVDYVENAIRNTKMEGGVAGIFNPMIIMRDLGLKEHSETEITGKDGGPLSQQININGQNDHIDMTGWSKEKKLAFENLLKEALKAEENEPAIPPPAD